MSKKSTHLPSAGELLDAIAGFLEKELLPALEGSRQFNTRVSINALRIVQRELSHAGTDEAELLQLAEQIRSGQYDENDPVLLARLRRHVLARLSVDNPKYSSYLAALDENPGTP